MIHLSRHFKLFKHTVEIAKVLEIRYIRLFSFFLDAAKVEEYRAEVMRRIKEFCNYVKGSDIVLLHENEKGIYGDTAERCLEIFKTMNSRNFKLIFDPANFVQCGVETFPHAFNMLKNFVVYMHIKDARKEDGEVVPSGYGDGHIQEILARLHKRGYEGVFIFGTTPLVILKDLMIWRVENSLDFKEESDVSKFKLATDSLRDIIAEVTNE